MRKVILASVTSLLALFNYSTVEAQSFSVQTDTVKYVVAGPTSNIPNKLTNLNSSGTIKVTWQVTYHNLPLDWQSVVGICDNILCYGNGVLGSSSATPPAPPFTAPGDIKLTDTFGAGQKCDFHMQGNFTSVSSGGPYYVTIKLTEGSTVKYTTFALTKWSTGINSLQNASREVNVYPNPARDQVNVTYDNNLGVKNISIVNLIGKVVKYYKPTDDSGANLNIDNMPAGVYLINLIDAQGHTVATKRFAVVQ